MAKPKNFRVGYGVSFEKNKVWHKISAELEIEVEESDDFAAVKKKAWDSIVAEIENKVQEIV